MNRKPIILGIIVLIFTFSILLYGCEQQRPSKEPITPTTTEPPITKPADQPQLPADDTGATSEGVNSVIDANNQFAFDFYSNLKGKEEGNIFFSPYSISTVLAMTYEGAHGETAEEIHSVFNFPEDENVRKPSFLAVYNQLNKRDAKYKLHTANALWVQNDYQLLNKYTDTIENYYGGKATNVDFEGATEETRKIINNWVEDKTNNKIKDLFPKGSLNSFTRLVRNMFLKRFVSSGLA